MTRVPPNSNRVRRVNTVLSSCSIRVSSEGELIEALKDADCAINQGHDFEPSMFAHMGNNGRCKGLVSFGHGYDGMDLESASVNGVVLSNTASFGTEEVSNQTMMLFLVCARKFVLHDKLVKAGEWTRQYLPPMGHIAGETFGIVGSRQHRTCRRTQSASIRA